MEKDVSTPLVSVIIPIYNIDSFLDDCVKSVINQSYSNLEIILVDDGSTDGCGFICDRYSKEDGRIKVIHKENGGLSDARNVALDICKGKFITFIDGDDVVSNNYVAKLYEMIVASNSEISMCSYFYFYNLGDVKPDISSEIQILSADDAIKEILTSSIFPIAAWGKLYDRKLFGGIRFPKGKIYEDVPTTWKLLAKTQNIASTKSQEYFYRHNPGSITHTKFGMKNFDIIEMYENLIHDLSNCKPHLLEYARGRFGVNASALLFYAIISGFSDIKQLRRLRESIRKNIGDVLEGRHSVRIRIFSVVFSMPFVMEICAYVNKIRSKIKKQSFLS